MVFDIDLILAIAILNGSKPVLRVELTASFKALYLPLFFVRVPQNSGSCRNAESYYHTETLEMP